MKIQSLAIIFLIIILPISLVLSSYIQTRIDTIALQTTYDSKLNDATYDALKAYQINSLNSDTSDYTNSKMRDIKASVNTFFNTMSSGFSTLGYTKETLQNFVPALVYTMYDGYYIYSPYKNTWDDETKNTHGTDTSYSNGENLYGLKPYVYYSCRYQKSGRYDIVINYSLDNYVQIQGYVYDNGKIKTVNKSGYLLGFYDNDVVTTTTAMYRGINITPEVALTENICYYDTNGNFRNENLKYIKKNGTKYYTDGSKVFSVLNGKAIMQNNVSISEINSNRNAINYYIEAYELQQFIKKYLSDLSTSDIVNKTGNEYYNIGKIFEDWRNIESETSKFNTHRIDVIKNSIVRNLSIVISNFNNYSGVTTNFQMPRLTDEDWDKIMRNISIISFLQGINIGGKIYNGYSIITNTKNEDIVMPDSIYILTKNDNTFHKITEKGLNGQGSNILGIFDINLERRNIENSRGELMYYYPAFPANGTLSYGSIVSQDNIAKLANQTLNDYINNSCDNNLKKVYYTSLGRERYGLYRQKLEI